MAWEGLEDGGWLAATYDTAEVEYGEGIENVRLFCPHCSHDDCGRPRRLSPDIFDVPLGEQETMRVTVIGIYDVPGDEFIEEVQVPVNDKHPVATAISEVVRLDRERLFAQIVAVLKVADDGGISPIDPDFNASYAEQYLTHAAESDGYTTLCGVDSDVITIADGEPTCPLCTDALV